MNCSESCFIISAAVLSVASIYSCGGDSKSAVSTVAAGSTDSSGTAASTSAANSNSVIGTVVDSTFVLSPTVEVGPFWVDEMLNRSDVTSDPTTNTSQQGVGLALKVYVHEANGLVSSPLVGCTVDIWQANALGVYSDESSENTSGQKWLRGYQVTDASGMVSFSTLVPGWYSGRTPHIHLRLRKTSGGSTFNWTTQAFVSDALTKVVYSQSPYSTHTSQDTFTTNDRLYQAQCKEGSTNFLCGDLLLLQATQAATGYQASLHLYVDSVAGG